MLSLLVLSKPSTTSGTCELGIDHEESARSIIEDCQYAQAVWTVHRMTVPPSCVDPFDSRRANWPLYYFTSPCRIPLGAPGASVWSRGFWFARRGDESITRGRVGMLTTLRCRGRESSAMKRHGRRRRSKRNIGEGEPGGNVKANQSSTSSCACGPTAAVRRPPPPYLAPDHRPEPPAGHRGVLWGRPAANSPR